MKYTIYKISNGHQTYVGMTTQNLRDRMAQHKRDAKSKQCSITPNLCKKEIPADLKRLHTELAKSPNSFTISKITDVHGTYADASKTEAKMKRKMAQM